MEMRRSGTRGMEMRRSGVAPSLALALIAKGKEQQIAIDNKSMLDMLMEALGADLPALKRVRCGGNDVKVSIKLDVPCPKNYVVQTTVVEGERSNSMEIAERSAVLKAIRHLNDTHHIKVLDYSSKVAQGIEVNTVFDLVSSAMFSLQRIVEQWEITLGKTKNLFVQLDRKDAADDVDQEYERWDRYGSLKEYMRVLVEKFTEKVNEAKVKKNDLELRSGKLQNRYMQKHEAELRKGYLQSAVVHPKLVLDYVLNHLGTSNARYSNTPAGERLMEGVAKFYIPPVPGIKYCGNIKIPGKDQYSDEAEQAAAFNALLFIEDKYKIRIVDLNHAERVTAEDDRKELLIILEEILTLSKTVQEYWTNMVKAISAQRDSYSMEAHIVFPADAEKKKIEAYNFCAKEAEALAVDSIKRRQNCAMRFQEMENLEYKLWEMKRKLKLNLH